MKKSTIFFVFALGALFMSILIVRPYESNYNIDEEDGMKNIIAKIKELAGNDSVYGIKIDTQYEERDMDFLTLHTDNSENKIRTQISFNRSGAFSNSVERKESNSSGYAKVKSFDVSDLSKSLVLIEECKKLIPESYKYRHTEYISVSDGRIETIKIAVAPQNHNNIQRNKHVYVETYKRKSYSGGRRRTKSKTVTHKYYIMEFNIDKDQKISQL